MKVALPVVDPVEATASPSPPDARIAVISHSHPSLTKGGAEISAYTLFSGLKAIGADVIFIAAVPEAHRRSLTLESSREFAVFWDSHLYDYVYHASAPSVSHDLCRLLTERQVDIANFHHFLAFGINGVQSAARLEGLSLYFTLHEFLAICQNHGQMITRPGSVLCEKAALQRCHECFPDLRLQQIAVRRKMFQDAFSMVDGFISPSKFLLDRYCDWGIPRERSCMIENGLAHVPTGRRVPVRGQQDYVFGFFGQINPFKGVDTILRAAREIDRDQDLRRRIRIRVHGNLIGQSDAFISEFTAAVSEIEFLSFSGPYDNASVSRLMADCDYVVVPSSWWENSPVVIQEAYSVGCPVICTGIGGMAEKVIPGVSGLHFRFRDASDLVRVMATASTPEMHRKLRAGVPGVTSAEQMAGRYLEAFGRLSSAANPRSALRLQG